MNEVRQAWQMLPDTSGGLLLIIGFAIIALGIAAMVIIYREVE